MKSLWHVPAQDGLLLVPTLWAGGTLWAAVLAGCGFFALRFPFTTTRIAILQGAAYAGLAAFVLPWVGLSSILIARIAWTVLITLLSAWVTKRFEEG